MTARHILFLGLALTLAPAAPRLRATTVEAPELDSLISQSDYIVRAVVRSATAGWREDSTGRRYIGTRVELEIRETIKGTPPTPLVLDLVGGRVGEDELVLQGVPRFYAGEEHVLFIHGAQRKMFPLVALMHGVYPVLREPNSGQALVLRSNGMPLYSAGDVSLPMDRLSAVKQLNPAARPLTAAAFSQQIRARAGHALPPERAR